MPTPDKTANRPAARLLRRYIGLETEYATVVEMPPDQQHPPSRQCVYDAVCRSLSKAIPTAKDRFDDCQMFLATGGAVSLESSYDWLDQPGGLIEGATPECISPKDLLIRQRAQDRLFAEAVAQCELPVSIKLLKNSRDDEDHVYGCQENYSADVATGMMLAVYRIGMLALIPLYMLYVAICLSFIFVSVTIFVSAKILGSFLRGRKPQLETLFDFPHWSLRASARAMRLVHAPLAGMLWLLAWTTAFRRQRKGLTAFLVSRTVLCGTGHLDARGKYYLSGKAIAINSCVGMGGYMNERPIYVFGHWLQQLCSESIMSPRSLLNLLHRRQRLQIGVSDSNVADAAEYLKIGATSLVLDMIEAGAAGGLPRLTHPLTALERIANDWTLISRVSTSAGPMTAIEIQRAYSLACRRFVRSCGDTAPQEAWQILDLWDQMLDAAQAIRDMPVDYGPSLAKIDWASKKWLIDQMGSDASLATRKKVDLKYHELSSDGYYRRLTDAVPSSLLATVEEVTNATRMPPVGSPASQRGQLIREFADSDVQIRASWSHIVIGDGRNRRFVRLRNADA